MLIHVVIIVYNFHGDDDGNGPCSIVVHRIILSVLCLKKEEFVYICRVFLEFAMKIFQHFSMYEFLYRESSPCSC